MQQSIVRDRTLVVIRHAKAEQDCPSDFERELAGRGHADAVAAGEWLAEHTTVPDHALVSSAVRTRQTWEALCKGADWELEATYDRGLYAADPDTALDILRSSPERASTIVMIGHNPTMGSLAQLLDDGEGEVAATNEMASGFPTSSIAVFGYVGIWADLGPASARVTAFHVGRRRR